MKKVLLRDICTPEKGKQINTNLLDSDNEYKYINGGVKESGYYSEYNTQGNVVIVSEGGASCGVVNFIRDSFWCGCHCYRLMDAKVKPLYLYYLLKYNQANIMALRTGAAMPNIKKSSFEQLPLKVDFDESKQQFVIDNLSMIENAIKNKEKQLSLLDELIKSRFIEMFGGVEHKKPLEELTSKITDGSHNPPKGIKKSNYLMLSSQNIHEKLLFNNVRYLTKEDFKQENKRTDVQNGDVLLTIVGTVGRTYVIKNNEKYVFQRSVGVIRPLSNLLNGTYLATYLQTLEAIHQLESGAHGSSQKGIYLSDLKKIQIPVADYKEQIDFEKFVRQIDKSKFVNHSRYFLCDILTFDSSTIAYSNVVSIFA